MKECGADGTGPSPKAGHGPLNQDKPQGKGKAAEAKGKSPENKAKGVVIKHKGHDTQ